ncbi:hypothetical protein [Streptomonospora litoralis]|uniref:Uncharacterized protein n=1 Tax=Streptomonospora litoralis TaxID=2498135 RepID=A0A4P6Q8V9_9ACTN|nr:hypothetical protein [Streptomonospora litoralis]QBI55447.1 hypothetical protein EKD16_18415 [Streptomonospora litoralis]
MIWGNMDLVSADPSLIGVCPGDTPASDEVSERVPFGAGRTREGVDG